MNRQQFLLNRLEKCAEGAWAGDLVIRNDDESLRLATSEEIREAAEFIPWVRDWLEMEEIS